LDSKGIRSLPTPATARRYVPALVGGALRGSHVRYAEIPCAFLPEM